MKLTIEKGIPVPPLRGQHTSELRNTLRKMKAGDSILIPKKKRGVVTSAIKDIFKKGNYTSRALGRNVRIWRLK